MAERIITLRGGRAAGVQIFGDPVADRFVVFCHPSPGSALLDPDPELTNRWGVHVVGLDRPGYGSSVPLPDDTPPSIADRADDLAEYLQVVQSEARAVDAGAPRTFAVVGWSAGGRVALALAARYPRLVDRLVVVATPAPHSAVPWVSEALAAENERLAATPLSAARRALAAQVTARVPSLSEPDATEFVSAREDRAILEAPGLRNRLQRMLTEGYRQGVAGVVDDELAITSDDWGFDLADVEARTLLLYGARDHRVPSTHGRWYRRELRHARLRVVPRAGHLAIVPGWRAVLEHVAPGGGPVSAGRRR